MSAASDIVQRAEDLGAAFQLKRGGVGVKAPRPLPPDLMAELRTNKAAIIEYLSQRSEQGAHPPSQTPQLPVAEGPASTEESPEEAERRVAFDRLRQIAGGQSAEGPETKVSEVPGPPIGFEPASSPQGQPDTTPSQPAEPQDVSSNTPPQPSTSKPTPPPPAPEPASPAATTRSAEFDQLRQQVAGAENAEPPTPKPSHRTPAADQPGPTQSGPVPSESDATDTSTWHAAFERLAARTGETPTETPDAAPASGEIHRQPQPSGGQVAQGEEPDLDDSAWRDAFQRLAARAEQADPAQPPGPKAGPSSDRPARPDVPREPPTTPSPASSEAEARSSDFEQLRRQVGGQEASEPGSAPGREPGAGPAAGGEVERLQPPRVYPAQAPAQAPSSESAARGAEFDQLRQQLAQEGAAPPTQVPSDEGASRSAEIEQVRRQDGDQSPIELPSAPRASGPDRRGASIQAGPPTPTGETATRQAQPDEMAGAPAGEAIPQPESPVGIEADPQDGGAESLFSRAIKTLKGLLTARKGSKKVTGPGIETTTDKESAGSSIGSSADWVRKAIGNLIVGAPKEVTSVTIEQGAIKLLVTRGLEVIDYRIVSADSRVFREGLVSDAPRASGVMKTALAEIESQHRRVVGAVPGYQTTLRRIELPNAKGMDPKVIIPREARRNLGISPENSHLTWHQLSSSADMAQWLILSATNRSVSSLAATATPANLRLVALDLRPFALARAINQPDAICAWTAPDGCDAVVIRDWAPVTHQTAYWGAGSMGDTADLINRITEVLESTIAAHDMQNPEMLVPDDIPLYVTGSPAGEDPNIARRVAANLRRPLHRQLSSPSRQTAPASALSPSVPSPGPRRRHVPTHSQLRRARRSRSSLSNVWEERCSQGTPGYPDLHCPP